MVFVQKVYLDFVGKCVQKRQKVVCVVSYLYQSLHLFIQLVLDKTHLNIRGLRPQTLTTNPAFGIES